MTNPQPTYTNAKENLRGIRIFFGAMVTGVVMFTLVVVGLYMVGGLEPGVTEMHGIVRFIVAMVTGTCLLIARTGYKKSVNAAKNLTGSLNDKLNNYRSFLIKYMALCDFPALASIICFFLTGDYLLLVATGIMIGAMFLAAPTKSRVIETLELDWNEQAQL
jgi:hypothetical protein